MTHDAGMVTMIARDRDKLLASISALHWATAEHVRDGYFSADIGEAVERIVNLSYEITYRMDAFGLGSRKTHLVVSTITKILPDSLNAYRRIPKRYAERRQKDGTTIHDLLIASLHSIEEEFREINEILVAKDESRIKSNTTIFSEKRSAAYMDVEMPWMIGACRHKRFSIFNRSRPVDKGDQG